MASLIGHLIERFTRVDPNTILYEFTVDDPAAFTKPWTAQAPLTQTSATAGTIFQDTWNSAPHDCRGGELGQTIDVELFVKIEAEQVGGILIINRPIEQISKRCVAFVYGQLTE